MQVCDHPFLLADSDQAGSAAADSLSGKLVVLDKLLRHLHSNNHKVLLLSHHPKVRHLNPLLPGSFTPWPCSCDTQHEHRLKVVSARAHNVSTLTVVQLCCLSCFSACLCLVQYVLA